MSRTVVLASQSAFCFAMPRIHLRICQLGLSELEFRRMPNTPTLRIGGPEFATVQSFLNEGQLPYQRRECPFLAAAVTAAQSLLRERKRICPARSLTKHPHGLAGPTVSDALWLGEFGRCSRACCRSARATRRRRSSVPADVRRGVVQRVRRRTGSRTVRHGPEHGHRL